MAGVIFTRDAAGRIRRAVRTVEGASRAFRERASAPLAPDDISITISNGGGATAPRGAVVKLTAYDSDTNVWTATKCAQENQPRIALVVDDIANTATGPALLAINYRSFVVLVDDIGDVSLGDRLGTASGSWGLVKDFMGPFVVIDKIDTGSAGSSGLDGLVVAQYLPVAAPPLLKTTGAPDSADEITAKQVDESFAVTGDDRTFLTDTS